ncbi:MAG: tRNA pseudouridine(54/55) synthase Pus10 [Desulfurococcales archaeon]|nr:tRNA pseudouridine(54/55) synthase Pus10 [Desulfurococcales archaeon]
MEGSSGVVEKAFEVLKKYPLCDRCLGRLFAGLGYGWSNKERGDALKRVMVMGLHDRIWRKEPGALEEFKNVAPNIGEQAAPLYEKLFGDELKARECYICGGRLEEVIASAARHGKPLLRAYDVTKYIVGVKLEGDVEERERSIRLEFGLPYGESIKAEIRREVGKLMMDDDMRPEFNEPEATLLVHYPSGELELQVNSLFIKVRYWKKARFISQAYWPSPEGPRYFSVEQAAWGLMRETGSERLILHASGREDIDARMLGSGRPALIELKAPRRRRIPLDRLVEAVNSEGRGLVEFVVEGFASRREVRLYKEDFSQKRKVYKALVAFEGDIGSDELSRLSEFFSNRLILQRTPRRVLHRRPDILRKRRVHSVKCRKIMDNVAECLVVADGGLYVKELVSGDGGRTTPSFSEVLGIATECVELDVVHVEHPSIEPSTLKPGA